MWKYILQRVALIFVTAFIILSLTYILLQLLPPEPAAGTFTAQYSYWEEQVRQGYYVELFDPIVIQRELANNAKQIVIVTDTQGAQSIPYYFKPVPVMQRYFNWLARIFTKWDWGVSNNYRVGASAMEIELQGLPYSMKINVVAIFISIPLGLALGVWAALKKNTWVDDTISTIIMIFISVPSFVLISFLLIWFSYNTSWLPARWPSMAEAEASPSWAFKAYIIPVSALSFGTIAGFARYTRAELTEVMSSEFLLLARTKGLTKAQSVVRHALRNSMVPIVPMIIGEFVGILSGSMVLEKLYSIPGVGDLFIKALSGKDYAVLMVDMAVYTLIGLFATLLTDLSYGFVDPRIRMGAVR